MNPWTSCWPRKCRILTRTRRTRRTPKAGLPAEGPEPYDEAQPRAGRLVAEDEGAHPDTESGLVARDVGIDGGAAGAEEAAVHVEDEDENPIVPG